MDPLTIALGLAQFAPQIVRWVSGSDKAGAAVEKVIDIAKSVTGAATGDAALEQIQANPELALAYRKAVMAQELELDKLFLADVQDARRRDTAITASGKRNYRADAMFTLALGVVLWLVYIVWKSPELPEYTKGVFTLMLGRFTGYLDAIYNFEYGTTRSSKTKDASIEQLTRRP